MISQIPSKIGHLIEITREKAVKFETKYDKDMESTRMEFSSQISKGFIENIGIGVAVC